MKKLLLIAIVGLVSSSSSWGINFGWQNDLGKTAFRWTYSGNAFGGNPFRFNDSPADPTPGGVDDDIFGADANDTGVSANDGFDYAGAGGTAAPGVDGDSSDPATGDTDGGLGDFVAIFRTTLIEQFGGDQLPLFQNASIHHDFEITGILYGVEDDEFDVDPSGHIISLGSQGGRMEFYLNNPGEYSPVSALTQTSLSGGDMIYDSINGAAANGGDDLAIPFVAFDLDQVDGFTDRRTINLASPTATDGSNRGSFWASVDDSWSNYDMFGKMFDTDTVARSGGISDIQVSYTMNLIPGSDPGLGDFNLAFNDPAIGAIQPIPEPSTLLLLGTGLLGMVGYARRRKV